MRRQVLLLFVPNNKLSISYCRGPVLFLLLFTAHLSNSLAARPGLSVLFFMLSVLGNLMYGLSLLAHNLSRQQVLAELPWLLGSLGTIVQDIIIFVQFKIYSGARKPLPATPA